MESIGKWIIKKLRRPVDKGNGGKEEIKKEEEEKEIKKSKFTKRMEMLMIALKAMTAMRLTREDKVPSEIIPGVYLGSVGCAYSHSSLEEHKITHILTCADKIKPRFPTVI